MLKAPSSYGSCQGWFLPFAACFLFTVITLWTDRAVVESGELSAVSCCVSSPPFPCALLVKEEGWAAQQAIQAPCLHFSLDQITVRNPWPAASLQMCFVCACSI